MKPIDVPMNDLAGTVPRYPPPPIPDEDVDKACMQYTYIDFDTVHENKRKKEL